jgi:hypothetical protein
MNSTATTLAEAAYTEDLAHVAQTQWFRRPADERFETLDALEAAVLARRERSTAEIVPVSKLLPQTNGDADQVGGAIRLATGTDLLTPTHWSFGQLAQKAKAPAAYLRTLPASIVTQALSFGLKGFPANDTVKVLALDPRKNEPNEEPLLQAITGPNYGRVWDADVVAGAKSLVATSTEKLFNPPDWSGRPSGLYASDRDCFILLINGGSIVNAGTRRGKPDFLNRGIIVSNSEVGKASLRATAFLFSEICGNHLIWGAQITNELRIPHFANAPERFAHELMPKLTDYFHTSARSEQEQILRAQHYMLPAKETDCAEFISKVTGVTTRLATKAMLTATNEEGQCKSLWDALQGLTAVARTYEHMDARQELERQAGKLMNVVTETNDTIASLKGVIDAEVV